MICFQKIKNKPYTIQVKDMDSKYIEEKQSMRLSKRLAYLLRYGAEKEGLEVKEGGNLLINYHKFLKYYYPSSYEVMGQRLKSIDLSS